MDPPLCVLTLHPWTKVLVEKLYNNTETKQDTNKISQLI